jgi:hypothetical protein
MNRPQSIIAAINVAGFILITVLAFMSVKFGQEWAKAMMDTVLPLLIGCWISNFTTIINYVFGTSAGSKAKSDLIAKLTTTPAEATIGIK